MHESIIDNIRTVKERINESACKSGRAGDDIELILVSKTVGCDRINIAIDEGIKSFGENKVQELIKKYNCINKDIKWHMIGHLQTNKVKYIIDKVEMIHSLDSLRLAGEIDKRAMAINKPADVLVQMNVAREESKFGIKEEELFGFLDNLVQYDNIKIQGLMTIAPFDCGEERIRQIFRRMKELFEIVKGEKYPNVFMNYLSMGMTNDYTIAIEEGANMVRLGSAVFGRR